MADEGSSVRTMSGFSEAQRNELVDIVSAAIRRHHRNHSQDQNQQNPALNPRSDAAPVFMTKELDPEEVGFFDPEYEGTGAVVNAGTNVFYRDVYAFVDRLKDLEQIKGEEKLRVVLPQCFRGSALIWHSTELCETEKTLLRHANLVAWCETLVTRFKQRTPLALKSLQEAKYTMANAKEKKDPRQFVQEIVRHARAAQITSVYNQLSMAWQNLDWQFRLHIPEPTTQTTLQQFLDQLDMQADTWFEMAGSLQRTGAGQSYTRQRGQTRFGQRGNWERNNADQPLTNYQPSQDAKQILNDLVRALGNTTIPQPDRRQKFHPRETSEKIRSETRSPPRVKDNHRDAKKAYSKDKNSTDKRNTDKGK